MNKNRMYNFGFAQPIIILIFNIIIIIINIVTNTGLTVKGIDAFNLDHHLTGE